MGTFVGRPSASTVMIMRAGERDSDACLDAIRRADPSAAKIVYALYADNLRVYLRRHTSLHAVENSVFAILVEAVRAVRELGVDSMEALDQIVVELAQQGVFGLRRGTAATNRLTLERRAELVNYLFTGLSGSEREIVLRSCVLSQRDDEISRQVEIPILQIRKTRAKARVLFRICCDRATDDNVSAAAS